MKSAHRHELQTNALAQRLDVAIQRLRPYLATVAWAVVAVAVLMTVWSYMSKSSASRQGDAWKAYNEAIGAAMPDLEQLHESSQEYPGTKMKEMADITWADGRVLSASQSYIHNRKAATDALNSARNVYQSIMQTSDDGWLVDRAHLGMARIYEMRNELDKARDEYLAVKGGYATYAKLQAERLAKPEAKDAYAWLDTAVAPRVQPPLGPGTPGQRPAFDATDLSLPEASATGDVPGATAEPATSIDDLLKGLQELPAESGDSPAGEQTPPADPQGPAVPPTDATGTEGAAPATETPAADSTATPPPATETNGAEEKSAE